MVFEQQHQANQIQIHHALVHKEINRWQTFPHSAWAQYLCRLLATTRLNYLLHQQGRHQ